VIVKIPVLRICTFIIFDKLVFMFHLMEEKQNYTVLSTFSMSM